ncbi:hypothetical protein COU61_02720 [Candidatus Pacearchaeota archaeon CG10_big_fil_rev_8_21_14_0_10_35_13]|nr:MAG: hypothetical protein COU61_02720 [Candidatus Pacearchaeota archaeon CG10_big_fil_rev_8_21_14_0_10_35_13]
MKKQKFYDVHGIHLTDYAPYLASIHDSHSSDISCSIVETASLVVDFSERYSGFVSILPTQSHLQVSNSDDPFSYENEKVVRFTDFMRDVHPGISQSFYPFLAIYPSDDPKYLSAIKSFRERLERPCGFKFIARSLERKIGELSGRRIMDFLDDLGAVLLLHTGTDIFSDPNQIPPLARKYPHVRFIAAHLGAFSGSFLRTIGVYDNIYVDSSIFSDMFSQRLQESPKYPFLKNVPENFSFEEFVDYIFMTFPIRSRILFGSDYPWIKLFGKPLDEERNLVLESCIDPELKSCWAYKNAERIFDKDLSKLTVPANAEFTSKDYGLLDDDSA